jgi:hypothetical protein
VTAEQLPDGDPFAPPDEPGHDVDEEGTHDAEECELCLERNHTVACDYRCGKCCESLLIEVSLRDAQREPRIKELCGPIWDSDIQIFEGRKEVGGYCSTAGRMAARACSSIGRRAFAQFTRPGPLSAGSLIAMRSNHGSATTRRTIRRKSVRTDGSDTGIAGGTEPDAAAA